MVEAPYSRRKLEGLIYFVRELLSVNPFTIGTRRVGIYRQSFDIDIPQNRTKGYFNVHFEISLDYILSPNISVWIFYIFTFSSTFIYYNNIYSSITPINFFYCCITSCTPFSFNNISSRRTCSSATI